MLLSSKDSSWNVSFRNSWFLTIKLVFSASSLFFSDLRQHVIIWYVFLYPPRKLFEWIFLNMDGLSTYCSYTLNVIEIFSSSYFIKWLHNASYNSSLICSVIWVFLICGNMSLHTSKVPVFPEDILQFSCLCVGSLSYSVNNLLSRKLLRISNVDFS